jgi:hypothetical protein
MSVLKKFGLVAAATGFGWEYVAVVLETHQKKQITLRPSYLLTRSGKFVKVYFFKIGQMIGVVYDKFFHYVRYVDDFVRHIFGNFFHYISVFVNDIVTTTVGILKPSYELVKSPFSVLSGFYNKLNELSPVNLNYIPLAIGTTSLFMFGWEYLSLTYENKQRQNPETPNYVVKYKPSYLLGKISTGLQNKFNRIGVFFGSSIINMYNFVLNLKQYLMNIFNRLKCWLGIRFKNAIDATTRLVSPVLSILSSPLYSIKAYYDTIKGYRDALVTSTYIWD